MPMSVSAFLMFHEAVLLKQGSGFHTELRKAYRFLFAGTQSAVGWELFVTKGMNKSHVSAALLDWKTWYCYSWLLKWKRIKMKGHVVCSEMPKLILNVVVPEQDLPECRSLHHSLSIPYPLKNESLILSSWVLENRKVWWLEFVGSATYGRNFC